MKLCSLISPQRLSSLQKMALSVGSGIPKKWLPPSRLPFALSSLLPSFLSFCSVSCIEAPLRLSRLVGYIVRCIYYHRHATSSCIPVLEDGACTISSEYEDFDQTSYSACQWPRVSTRQTALSACNALRLSPRAACRGSLSRFSLHAI